MESSDIASDEKHTESDGKSKEGDVEMKYEINEDQKSNHEKEEEEEDDEEQQKYQPKEKRTEGGRDFYEYLDKIYANAMYSPKDLPDHENALSSIKSDKYADEQEDEETKKEEESDDDGIMKPIKDEKLIEMLFKEEKEIDKKYKDDKDKSSNEKEKSTQGQDVPEDNPAFDRLSLMGRNRRVRQKNRYFLDFHCIDLTKGARSNKDDYECLTTAAPGTRSSNRRSTTDSNRGHQDETDGIESRYCRKCSTKTLHDIDGGCQPCLYKEIIEKTKRQRPSGQRGRSNNSRHHHTKQQQQQRQQNDNDVEPSSNTTNISKRKANRQGGSRINGNNSNLASINSNINNISNIDNTDTNVVSNTNNTFTNNVSPITNDGSIVDVNTKDTSVDNLPRLDSWTPDEVAEYILSKGFTQEAELFKMQSVDGISLLLMQRTDFTYGLKIKLGPALKIYDQVCKLKKEYFKSVATTN